MVYFQDAGEVGPGPVQQAFGICSEYGQGVAWESLFDREWFDGRAKGLIEKKEEAWQRMQQVANARRWAWAAGEINHATLCAYRWGIASVVDYAFQAMVRSPVALFKAVASVLSVMELESIADVEAGIHVDESYLDWFIGNGSGVPYGFVEHSNVCIFQGLVR